MRKTNKNVIHDIVYHPKERLELFRKLPVTEQEAIFEVLSPHVQQNILEKLKDNEIISLLDQMDLQRAENTLIRIKNSRRRKKIIFRLKGELKEKSEYFLRFHPKAAITLLDFNYLLFSSSTKISEVADAIDEHYREVGKLPEILVHESGRLIGEVPVSLLIRENNNKTLKNYTLSVKTIYYQAEIKEIINSFTKTKHKKLVVLDEDDSVIGIIYSDEALALFENKSTLALYNFAGVSKTERSFDSVFSKVRSRYKWLIINLCTAFIAALVIGLFRDTIDRLVILAVYMPIIAGMGGNTATQTLAVIVRGITVREIELKNGLPAILREAGAGFINGVINGFIIAVVATLWNGNPLLGLVLAIAMIFNLFIAGLFGAFVPLLMKSIGKDPATSATVFITTATDVFGFMTFLGLATLIL